MVPEMSIVERSSCHNRVCHQLRKQDSRQAAQLIAQADHPTTRGLSGQMVAYTLSSSPLAVRGPTTMFHHKGTGRQLPGNRIRRVAGRPLAEIKRRFDVLSTRIRARFAEQDYFRSFGY